MFWKKKKKDIQVLDARKTAERVFLEFKGTNDVRSYEAYTRLQIDKITDCSALRRTEACGLRC